MLAAGRQGRPGRGDAPLPTECQLYVEPDFVELQLESLVHE